MSNIKAATVVPNQLSPGQLLTVQDLAILLRCSTQTIINNRNRAPWRVPPACRPVGTSRLLWRFGDVMKWLDQQAEEPVPPPRRRGRPPKATTRVRGAGAQQ